MDMSYISKRGAANIVRPCGDDFYQLVLLGLGLTEGRCQLPHCGLILPWSSLSV